MLHELIAREHRRQAETLTRVAASSIADPAVLACQGSALLNTTTEGYPDARFHAECEVVDPVERLAVERARRAFGARFANVQPHSHSGTSANQIVMFGLRRPATRCLGWTWMPAATCRTGAGPPSPASASTPFSARALAAAGADNHIVPGSDPVRRSEVPFAVEPGPGLFAARRRLGTALR